MPGKFEDKFPLTFMGSFITLSMLSSPCLCFPVYPITFYNKQSAVVNIDHHSSSSHTWADFSPFPFHHVSQSCCQSLLLPWFRYCISFSFYFYYSVNDSSRLNLCYKISAMCWCLKFPWILPVLWFPKLCSLAMAVCAAFHTVPLQDCFSQLLQQCRVSF